MRQRGEEAAIVFIVSAAEDEAFCAELIKHLVPLEQAGIVEVRHAGHVKVGEDEKKSLFLEIDRAHIMVLLVSADLWASESARAQAERALKRHHASEASVLSVRIRSGVSEDTPIRGMKVLPVGGGAVDKPKNDTAWTEVADAIRAEALDEPSPTSVQSAFVQRVERVCQLREPRATLRRRRPPKPFAAAWEIEKTLDESLDLSILVTIGRPPVLEEIEVLGRWLDLRYREADRSVSTELVYGGP